MRTKTLMFMGAMALAGLILGFIPNTAAADALYLNQNTINISMGQTVNVNFTPPYNQAVNITSNQNTSVVTASVSGNTLILTGLNNGYSQVQLCTYNMTCGTVYVTVGTGNGNYYDYNNRITLTPSSLSMNVGESRNVSITSGYYDNVYAIYQNYYVSNNTNSNIVSTYINGSSLEVRALNSGSATVTICSNNASGCADLYITVANTSSPVYLSQSSVTLNQYENKTVYAYGGSGSFYLSNTGNNGIVTASLSNSNTINLYGVAQGSSTISVCSNNNSACASLYVTVNQQYNNSLQFSNTNLPQPYINSYYSHQLQAWGGTPTYYYSVISGSLPDGLSLNSNGLISGNAYNNIERSFTVKVTDSYGRQATQWFTLRPTGSVYGTSIYHNGTLVNDNGTIYLIYKNTKSGFANMESFNGLGYKNSNVISGSTYSIASSGYTINNMYTAHAWGTWVKSGNTVYFVHQNGLIPVSSYDIFINNQGKDAWVVPANNYDFNKGTQSIMEYNDYRLK